MTSEAAGFSPRPKRYCGIRWYSRSAGATGIAASTIGRGLKELAGEAAARPGRVRRAGGGRKTLISKTPSLLTDLLTSCAWRAGFIIRVMLRLEAKRGTESNPDPAHRQDKRISSKAHRGHLRERASNVEE